MTMGTGEAGAIIGKSPKTVERWVDDGKLTGGRPTDPLTAETVSNSHRWVDARHAVLYAIGGGRAHLIPPRWHHLVPDESRHLLTSPAPDEPAGRHAAA